MNQMKIGGTDLSAAWSSAVAEDRFANIFPAPEDDAEGRWNKGTLIKVSLGVVGNSFGFQVTNTETGEAVGLGVEKRNLGLDFALLYSEARALRPGGSALPKPGRQPAISASVEDCRFNCLRPELPRSIHNHILMARVSEPRLNWDWHVYANAFPGRPWGQFLWVPVQTVGGQIVIPHLPQRWGPELLEDFMALADMSQGVFLLWNSYPGGGASVLHCHFHSIANPYTLAVEHAVVGRKVPDTSGFLVENYPARGIIWESEVTAGELYSCDVRLTSAGYPPNLLCIGGRTFMFPRDPEGEVSEEYRSGVDLSGEIPVASREVWQNTTLDQLQSALKKATADADAIVEILST